METMDKRLTAEDMKQREQQDFTSFMAKPETQLTISLIPAGDHQEALATLARAAFAAGSASGQGVILMEMIKGMFAKQPT